MLDLGHNGKAAALIACDPAPCLRSPVCLWRRVQTGQEAARTKGVVKTQLIAHDQEVCESASSWRALLTHACSQVYDISFAKSKAGNTANTFATVGADGSLRMFDLRYVGASQYHVHGSTFVSPSNACLLIRA
jgi:hypothetical protein